MDDYLFTCTNIRVNNNFKSILCTLVQLNFCLTIQMNVCTFVFMNIHSKEQPFIQTKKHSYK